jgi:acyl dehydratase
VSDGAADSYFAGMAVGDTKTTEGRTITEADVVNFAGVSGDFNHIHTDAERMKESSFGERIAHGALVFSVATGLLWRARSEEEREAVVAFYGVDRLRFLQPVFIGDTVHVETEIVEKEPRPDHPVAGGVVRYDVEVINQDDEPVIACQFLSMLE